ncbi:ATP-binding protein, partial [Vibrio parahaemolyticus]|nr:ATP-binding protein [Vibrio parahaemolyticus]
KRLPYLRTGDVFISSAVVGRTIFARIRAAYTISPHTQNPFDELKMKKDEDDEKLMRIVLDKLPIAEMDILDTIREIEKDEKVSFTIEEFTQKLENLYKKKLIGREETIFGYRYIKL